MKGLFIITLLLLSSSILAEGDLLKKVWELNPNQEVRASVIFDFPMDENELGRLTREVYIDPNGRDTTYFLEVYSSAAIWRSRKQILSHLNGPDIYRILDRREGGIAIFVSYKEGGEMRKQAFTIMPDGRVVKADESERFKIVEGGVLQILDGALNTLLLYPMEDAFSPTGYYGTYESAHAHEGANGEIVLLYVRENMDITPFTMYLDGYNRSDTIQTELVVKKISSGGDLLWETTYPSERAVIGTGIAYCGGLWHISAVLDSDPERIYLAEGGIITVCEDGNIVSTTVAVRRIGIFTSFEVSSFDENSLFTFVSTTEPGPHGTRSETHLIDANHRVIHDFSSKNHYRAVTKKDSGLMFRRNTRYYIYDSNYSIVPNTLPDIKTHHQPHVYIHYAKTEIGGIAFRISPKWYGLKDSTLFIDIIDDGGAVMRRVYLDGVKVNEGRVHTASYGGDVFFAVPQTDGTVVGLLNQQGDLLWSSVVDSPLQPQTPNSIKDGWALPLFNDGVSVILFIDSKGEVISQWETTSKSPLTLFKRGETLWSLRPLNDSSEIIGFDAYGKERERVGLNLPVVGLHTNAYGGYSLIFDHSGDYRRMLGQMDDNFNITMKKVGDVEHDLPSGISGYLSGVMQLGDALFLTHTELHYVERLGWQRQAYSTLLTQQGEETLYKGVTAPFIVPADLEGRVFFSTSYMGQLTLYNYSHSVSLVDAGGLKPARIMQKAETGALHLAEPGTVRIYTLSGREAMSYSVSAPALISLSDLSAGIYVSLFRSIDGTIDQMRFVRH